MSEATHSHADQFNSLIKELARSCHGSTELKAVKSFLAKDLVKTADRESFLLPKLLQQAIIWDEVKKSVWPDKPTQDANHFQFLQGDVIGTTMVLALGTAESNQDHDLWLVLSPDCDCVRAKYVRVAPVFEVFKGQKSEVEKTQRFGYTLKLASTKAFPLPPIPGDSDPDLRGYFADLEEPFYINKSDMGFATPYAPMTVEGWHLLNGLIQENETRAANIAEATAIRTRQ